MPTPYDEAEAAPTAISVYVLSSGNATTDAAVVSAIMGAGHSATLGVQPGDFNGAQSLVGYHAVLLQNSHNWASSVLGLAGQTALKDYVNTGGGLVTGEWTLWRASPGGGGLPNLSPVFPGQMLTGFTSGASTTYTQVTPDPIINDGIPSPFNFALGNVSGSELFIEAKTGATVFYTSSLTGASPSVVGWGYGSGRAINLSSLITSTELENATYRKLLVNTLVWTAQKQAGGKNLTITTGSIGLSWDGGTAQDSYSLLKYNTSTAVAQLIPIAGAATSYSDAAASNGVVYCYALAALNGATFLGLSDLLCGMAGLESGAAVPQDFGLKLGGTASATMTWAAPIGGADNYLLQVIPLDGSPITNLPLAGGVTTSTQPVTPAGTCFQLIAFKAGGFGTSNLLCGVPGVSTLGLAGAGTSAFEVLGEVAGRLESHWPAPRG